MSQSPSRRSRARRKGQDGGAKKDTFVPRMIKDSDGKPAPGTSAAKKHTSKDSSRNRGGRSGSSTSKDGRSNSGPSNSNRSDNNRRGKRNNHQSDKGRNNNRSGKGRNNDRNGKGRESNKTHDNRPNDKQPHDPKTNDHRNRGNAQRENHSRSNGKRQDGKQPNRQGQGGARSEQTNARPKRRRKQQRRSTPRGSSQGSSAQEMSSGTDRRDHQTRNQRKRQTKRDGRRRTMNHRKSKRQDGRQGARGSGHDQPHFSPQVLSLKDESPKHKRHRAKKGPASRQEPVVKPKENTRNLSRDSLKVIPLGGLCEVGKNMTVLEYGQDMIIIDVGVAFPEEHQPGIDSVIQDYNYVLKNKEKLRGVFLTHGHEDHIGALPFFLKSLRDHVNIYASPLTAELIKLKLEDRGAKQYTRDVKVVRAGEHRKAGVFDVEFIHVNHSIADACALAIDTPLGKVVHSGDFKIDYTPIHGEPANLARLTEIGNEGVLLLLCESTNIEREGFSMSEKSVGKAFEEHFSSAKGRLFVATFSSNVSRVQQIITAAERFHRKVAIVGRSMHNVFNAANKLGYLKMRKDTLIELHEVNKYKPEEVCIISTGSQGEPMSALTRMAFAEHRNVEIREGDTVIISATPIPGNEKPIYRVIDELYKRGAKVIYSAMAEVHASGHGYREEIKLMHQLTRPKYFIPVHGEYRMLYIHAEIAHNMGQPWDSIYILNNGDIFETTGETARIGGYTRAGAILIDGSSTAAGDSPVLQERRELSDEGVVAITVGYDPKRGHVVGHPAVVTSGFVFGSDVKKLENDCSDYVLSYLKKNLKGQHVNGLVQSGRFRNQMMNFFYNHTRRRPVLLVNTLEVSKV